MLEIIGIVALFGFTMEGIYTVAMLLKHHADTEKLSPLPHDYSPLSRGEKTAGALMAFFFWWIILPSLSWKYYYPEEEDIMKSWERKPPTKR